MKKINFQNILFLNINTEEQNTEFLKLFWFTLKFQL